MKTTKKVLLGLFLLSFTTLMHAQNAQAKSIIEKTIAKFNQAAVKADFELVIHDTKAQKKDIYRGEFILKGDKFKTILPAAHTYYDGKTEYIHLVKNNEVTVITPTKEELQEINPAFILINSTKKSTIQFSADEKANSPYHLIDIFPYYNDKKPYYKAIATINKKTFELVSIKVLSKNGIHSTLTISKFQSRLSYDDSSFTFNFKANPKVVINDLR